MWRYCGGILRLVNTRTVNTYRWNGGDIKYHCGASQTLVLLRLVLLILTLLLLLPNRATMAEVAQPTFSV